MGEYILTYNLFSNSERIGKKWTQFKKKYFRYSAGTQSGNLVILRKIT
jgi:hypothetical protein